MADARGYITLYAKTITELNKKIFDMDRFLRHQGYAVTKGDLRYSKRGGETAIATTLHIGADKSTSV